MSTSVAPAMTSRRGLWRWAVALVATALLIVSGSGLVVFAQSGAGESQGPQFVPADAPIYIEARLDMPAGQDEALAQMLTAFPGFADPGMFQTKMDELVAGLTDGATAEGMPEGALFGDILTGEIGIAITDLESAMNNEEPTMLMGMVVADPAVAEELAEAISSGTVGSEDAEAVVEQVPGGTAIVSDMTSSAAVHGDWVLFSNDADQVEAAIAVLDGNAPSLAADPDFAAAFSRVPAARLGAAYVNLQSFGSFIDMAAMMAEGQAGIELPMDSISAMLPRDMVMFLAAADDRLTLEALITPGDGTPDVPVGESDLADLFPADTQLYVETRELGATVEMGLDALAELLAAQAELMPADDPGAMGAMGEIDMLFSEESPIASMLGVPLPQALDFVGDAAVGAAMSSDGVWMGIAGEVSDEAVAEDRVSNVLSLLRLFGGNPAETGISVETEMVGDVEVTKIMLPLEEMTAETGLSISLGDSVSVAVADGALLIGLGDFVQSALSADDASLGASDGFVDAIGEDTPNVGLLYANISSLLGELEPMLAMMSPEWAEIAPYATGLDRMVAVGTADDEVIRARMTIIVGQ